MVDIKEHPAAPLVAGIMDLERELSKRGEYIELNVVGGFAMMMHGNRDMEDLTDIDYVGGDLEYDISKICDKIGHAHNLGAGWINNDLMLPGTSVEDLEISTGKLHFDEAIDLPHVKVNILREDDLLRMKLISVDTSFSAVELGGDFTRAKDFPDVIKLMNKLGYSFEDLEKEFGEYLINPNTIDFINDFKEHGIDYVVEKLDEIREEFSLENTEKEEGEFSWENIAKIMGTDLLQTLLKEEEKAPPLEEKEKKRPRSKEKEFGHGG